MTDNVPEWEPWTSSDRTVSLPSAVLLDDKKQKRRLGLPPQSDPHQGTPEAEKIAKIREEFERGNQILSEK
jgi:hypothetical protein